MKKLLSMILCISMILSFANIAAGAEAESLTPDAQTLKKFGFDIDEAAYNTQALKPGTHAVETQNELVVTTSILEPGQTYTKPYTLNSFYEFEKNYITEDNTHSLTIKRTLARTFDMKLASDYFSLQANDLTPPYFVTSSFDPDCRGMKAYTAKLSYKWWSNAGGTLSLQVYPTNTSYTSPEATTTISTIYSTSSPKMWLVEGLLSITTGDFDGDGSEEIAVYAPDNEFEYYGRENRNKLEIKIFSYDPKNRSLTQKQVIDLADMGDTGKTCTWNHSKVSDRNCEYYRLPYVALTADDVNGDGIDDLMAVMNFSTQFNGISSDQRYTTSQVLDPTTCWASLLEVYEGRQNGDLVNTVLHKPLVANGSGDNADYRYVIRHANAIVADVTAEGSKEIVIGGRYTKIEYKKATGSTLVNKTRESYRPDEYYVFANILGYASYETIKNYPVSQEGASYKWVLKNATTDTLRHYEYSENNPIQQPVSLCGYKFNGFGHPDRIFIEGQSFEYNQQSDTLEFKEELKPTGTKKSSSTNRWYGRAAAANACDDVFGTEILAVTYFNKIDAKDQFYTYITTIQPRREFNRDWNYITGLYSKHKLQTVSQATTTEVPTIGGKSSYHVCLDWGDIDNDSTFIRYENGDTDVYYTNVEALAIMQAPPLYEELNDDTYLGNSATGFAKSRGEGTGSSLGGSLTAGVVAGFEQETSFLGLFKVAGGSFEAKVTATASYDKSTSSSFDYSTGFETSGTTDAVTIFTVPYVRYNCTMIMPKYQVPSEEEYNIKRAFRDELKANIEAYAETNVDQISGKYAWELKEYDYMYHSRVYADNYGEQLGVLETVSEEVDAIEKAVAACGKGGDKDWGEIVENAVLPYHYCVPQAPLITTVDVETYDAIADSLGLDKISEKVFNDGYMAGDPNTYAHDVAQLKKGSGKVLEGKNTASSTNDGFLTNSNLSAPGTIQSQSISVSTEEEQTLGWAVGTETTTTVNAGGAFVGITASAEINGSYVWTTTKGNEYTGAVVALPQGTSNDYSYNWKLVAYNAKLNGKDVPVVGYLTKVTAIAPPSVAQNISVENVTDKSATITWEDGLRKADYYTISRVAYDINGKEQYYPLAGAIKSVDGKCSYTINNIQPSNTSYYVIESYARNGKKSIASQTISVTTMPEGFAVVMSVEGIENAIYRDGKNLFAKLNIDGNQSYDTFYQWQVSDGNDWVDLDGQTAKTMNFKISTLDNDKKVRCAVTMFIGSRSYSIYSAPITLRCTNFCNGYSVDWAEDGNSVTITPEEGATPANIYLKAENANGISKIMYEPSSANGITFNTSDVASDDMRIYIWENNLAPVTYPFVR